MRQWHHQPARATCQRPSTSAGFEIHVARVPRSIQGHYTRLQRLSLMSSSTAARATCCTISFCVASHILARVALHCTSVTVARAVV